MTENEIIKALECCGNPLYYCNDRDCKTKTIGNALDLINRQNAELSKKDTEIDILIRKKEALRDEVSGLKAENEELQHKIASCNAEIEKLEFDNVHWNDWEVKCRAIKEFAERLKENALCKKHFYIIVHQGSLKIGKNYSISENKLDNLVKEMTEVEK